MFKTLSATTLAAAVAIGTLSPNAAQAQASNLEKFLLGAGLLAAVAYAVKEHNDRKDDDDKDDKTVIVRKQQNIEVNRIVRPPNASIRNPGQYPVLNGQVYRPGVNRYPGSIETRHTLPASCERTFKTQNGDRTLLPVACLEHNGVYAQSLPQACLRIVDVKGERHDRQGFGVTCLKNNGYRIR